MPLREMADVPGRVRRGRPHVALPRLPAGGCEVHLLVSTRRKPQRPHRVVSSTGIRIQAAHHYHAWLPDVPPGEHVWCLFGVWRVKDPTAGRFDLDVENLVTIEGPGCLVCERPYSPQRAAGPCTGDAGC